MRATTVGGLVGGIVASAGVGTLGAFVVAMGVVAPECPDYDDEGSTAAPGSIYTSVMCGGYGEVPLALLVPVLAALVVATALAVVLGRDRRTGPTVAGVVPVVAAALVPLLTLLLMHHVLPRDCLGGDDGSPACETDRELL